MDEYREKLLRFYHAKKRMPSFAELAKLWGYRTKSAVDYRLEKLIEAGIVAKDAAGKIVPKNIGGARLLGLVEAGFPSPAEEELLDVLDFDEFLVPNKESSYILKVKGDSMIDAGIHPGDMVIVERKAQYKTGQIIIASVDGEYTMKYLRKDKKGNHYLEPANAKYKPIYPSETFRVEAVVTAVVRKY